MALHLIGYAVHAVGHGLHALFHAKAAAAVHHGLGAHATGAAASTATTGAGSTASGTMIAHGTAVAPTFGFVGVDPTLQGQLDYPSLLNILTNQASAASNADPSLLTSHLQNALQASNLSPTQDALKIRDLLINNLGTKSEVANEVMARLIENSANQ